MSTDTGTSSRNSQAPTEGEVRTYRGKRLADLLPKIRQELGADAIILREREGLVGGINGFFAQRFVEVDARAGGPRIDIRDDDEEFDEPISPPPGAVPEAATPSPFFRPAGPGEAEGEGEGEPKPGARETPTPFPQGPLRRELEIEAEKFERFLDVAAEAERARVAATAEAELARQREAAAADMARQRDRQRGEAEAAEAEVRAEQLAEAERKRAAAAARRRERTAHARAEAARAAAAAEAARETPDPTAAPAELIETLEAVAPTAAVEAPAPPQAAPTQAAAPRATTVPAGAPPKVEVAESPRPAPTPARRRRSGGQASPRPLDAAKAAAVAEELTTAGLEEMWIQRLIVEGAAYHAPFLGDDLRLATRQALARALPRPPVPPAGGARVAFVGPGGSGKTRLTAALAATLRRGSTMPVKAISLAGKEQGRRLSSLLEQHGVSTSTFAAPKTALKAVHKASEIGVMVLDTPPLAAADPGATAALAEGLRTLELDMVYLALPAGLGHPAARRLIEAAAPLRPAAVAITHADEAVEIGEVVQAATEAELPVAFVAGGPDLLSALNAVDPSALAARLMP